MRWLALTCGVLIAVFTYGQDEQVSVLGKQVPSFTLHAVNAVPMDLASTDVDIVALVFVCNHCPMAKLYWSRINQTYLDFKDKKVLVVAVNPMDTLVYKEESFKEMKKKVRNLQLQVPYVQDGDQGISTLFQVPHTPHAIVLKRTDTRWTVVYEGAFDDNGAHPELAEPFVVNALNACIAGKEISKPSTPSFGCRVYYRNN
jgi:glutaredoxin